MKIVSLLIILILQSTTLSSQQADPIVKKTRAAFANYNQSKNIEELYIISGQLPKGIYILNVTKTEEAFNISRQERTKLYIKWVAEMMDTGYNLKFDRSDPNNECKKFSSVCSCNAKEKKAWDEAREKNNINCKNLVKHQMFRRTMDRFRAFYESGYKNKKKGFDTLVNIIESTCTIEDLKKETITNQFRKELGLK